MNEDTNKTNSKFLKIFLIIVLFALITFIPITIYFYINPPQFSIFKNVNKNETFSVTAKEDTVVKKDSETLNNAVKNTSSENVSNYLKDLNAKLGTGNSKTENDILLLRKAIFLSLNRDKNTTKNFQEATGIFVNLINSNQDSDTVPTYLRNYSKIALAWLYVQCCNSETSDAYIFSKKIENYQFTYNEYKASSKNIGMSKFLALSDFMTTVDPFFKTDTTYKRIMIDIETKLLTVYSKNLNKQITEKIIDELGENIEHYSENNKLTFTDPIMTQVEAKALYNYGYDTYKQKTNSLTDIENKIIDQNYEEINNLLANPPADTDPIGLRVVIYFNNLRLLMSMSQRYADSIDMEKLTKLIAFQLNLITSNKEIGNIAYNYFHSQEYRSGQIPGHIYFASLRTKYKEVDEYLRSIGI